MRLSIILFIVVTSLMNHSLAANLHLAIVTASNAETPGRGRSFAGILTRVERPVRRAVELALFESKTSFEAFGIVPELQVIDIDATKPLDEQLKAIRSTALTILDLPRVRVH